MDESPKQKKRLPLVMKLSLIALGLLIAAAIYNIPAGRLDAEIARLRAEGVLRDAEELTPEVPPGTRNAAELYEQAVAAVRLSAADARLLFDDPTRALVATPPAQWNTAEAATADRLLRENRPSLALVSEASRLPVCAFPRGYWGDQGPAYMEMRKVISLLQLQGSARAADGDTEGAVASCATMLRIADHLNSDPVVRSQTEAYWRQIDAIGALQTVLNQGTPSPEASRRLFRQIAAIDNVTTAAGGLQGELAYAYRVMQGFREKGDFTGTPYVGGGQQACARVGRPLVEADMLRYLKLQAAQIEACQLPWPGSLRASRAISREGSRRPLSLSTFTRSNLCGYHQILAWREVSTAYLRSAQVALALKVYRAEHGGYPSTLTVLEQEGWKLPLDPFSGKPYRYHRAGPGFVVYSVGPDGTDDGAVQPYRLYHPDVRQCDVVFRCDE